MAFSKRMLSIFLMHVTTIHKKEIIFAIFYIFYGVQDNYTEKMVVPNKFSNVVKKQKKQTTILFLSRCYFGFSITFKIIYFTIISLFTV